MQLSQPMKGKISSIRAFTLIEVMVSLAIASIVIGGTIYGYVMSSQRAEWSAYSLAAHSFALQRLEQVRAGKWDLNKPAATGDQITTNKFPRTNGVLDIPSAGTNVVHATNFTTILNISTNPSLKSIRVDCVWYFAPRKRLFTNTIVTYRSPDNY